MEAWYRCFLPPAVWASTSFNNASYPNGVFWSRGGVAGDLNVIETEFSHTSTQLCGTATRQYGSGDGVYESFRACSVRYPTTMGLWVHGAMTFDAPTGVIQFYLNGLPLATGNQSNSNITVIAGATTPRSPDMAPVLLAGATIDPAGVHVFTYMSAGTAVDNLRLWNAPATPAQIAASWNHPLPLTGAPGLLGYAVFHRNASKLIAQGYPSDLELHDKIDPEAITYINPISTPSRSCDKAGCGVPGTAGSDAPVPVSSSSSTAGTGAASTGAATAAASTAAAAGSSGSNGAASSTAAAGQPGAASAVAQLSGWSMILAGAALALAQLVQ